jgi:hypothetical protein
LLLRKLCTPAPTLGHADPHSFAFRIVRKLRHRFALGLMPHEMFGRSHHSTTSTPPSVDRQCVVNTGTRSPFLFNVGSANPITAVNLPFTAGYVWRALQRGAALYVCTHTAWTPATFGGLRRAFPARCECVG